MSGRWTTRTERCWEQPAPLMAGPIQQAGPAGEQHAGVRPPLGDRQAATRRARVTVS